MAYAMGEGRNAYDVLEKVFELLTSGTLGWIPNYVEYTSYEDETRLSHFIAQGVGDGNDKIYIQCFIPDADRKKIIMDSSVGYDANLRFWEQPGSLQQWYKSEGLVFINQPCLDVLEDERFWYWIFADTYRVIVVCRMSIVYESAYVGFITPVSSERQYPYPMYVAGNNYAQGSNWPNNITGSFISPTNNSAYLRRADGTWRAFNSPLTNLQPLGNATIFPYNTGNKKLIPNFKEEDAINQDNYLMIPILLETGEPVDVSGLLRGVYWVSGTRDIAAEQIIVYHGEQFIVFDTKQMRTSNSYYCVRMV